MAWIQICIIALLLAGILQTMASDSDMDECHRLDKFICNVSRQCIPKVLVCNGYQECTENEDESPPTCTKEVCRRNERFFCDVSRMCIDELFVCTGYKDCTSGEDESPPACTMDLCHENNLFFCNVSRQCIHKGFVCNGYPDCPHHDDEDSLACALKRQCESNWSISEGCLGRCKPGYFGKNCEKTCSKQCLNGACNSSNGICKDCNPGYFGKYCQTCSEKCLNKICNSSSGICKDCSSGYFGKYCEKNCSNNCLNGICNRSNGICTDCKAGYFGKFCEKTCSKECLNGTCIRENGICEYCTRTYLESCSIECGQGCKEKDGFPQCDRQSGNCLNGCVLNYYGNYCNESCNNCKRNSSVVLCDNNGVCLYGCKNEYWDERCSSKCSANCKGDEQGNQCNSSTGECMNGCKPGWSGNLCGDASSFKTMATESTDKDHSLKTPLIVISAIFTVVVVAVGIICYIWARKRFNRHQIEHMEPRRVFPVHVPQGRQPSRSRRRQSSHVYSDIDEETMENYHYICEQNPPDHYDKVNDRPPCICSHCVRERVQPMLNRAPSCFSVVKPYATGGGDIRRTSSIHSYISNRELNTRRSITEYGSESGIVSTKEITDDSNSRRSITNSGGKDELDSAGKTKPRLGVTHSDSDLERVDKKNKTKGDTPRRCVAKSKSSIELVSTNDYLDLEALYQTAKEEDRRKLAAKYFDEGEEVFGNLGQFQSNSTNAIAREDCELLSNELEHQNKGQNIESPLLISRSELIEESCFADDRDLNGTQQPAQLQHDATMADQTNTKGQ
ncbi:uncharacterized protein LOC128235848 isoform X2 [Mya arenaria]|uniref:uncharacterized protein LOC128235848 isoform X2 n=1 Tax=Mya arenaria TaxID=6604 RepID=UPI0022DF18FA|nr:uncharacterized protein LOC128235848 isoform X2 [Mya arenaria]